MKKTIEKKDNYLFGVLPIWSSVRTHESNRAEAGDHAVDAPKFPGTKGDIYAKELLQRIIDEGCINECPSSTYDDGAPSHTLSINHGMMTYDLTKGEIPLMTLRPIAIKSAIGELLWIYQDQSNDLNLLRDK